MKHAMPPSGRGLTGKPSIKGRSPTNAVKEYAATACPVIYLLVGGCQYLPFREVMSCQKDGGGRTIS